MYFPHRHLFCCPWCLCVYPDFHLRSVDAFNISYYVCLLVMNSFSICRLVLDVIFHFHFWKTFLGEEAWTLGWLLPSSPLKMLLHCLLTASDEKSNIIFIFIFCLYCLFLLTSLEMFFFFNGVEQFNSDVAPCGLFNVSCAHNVHLALWKFFCECFSKNYFFPSGLFRNSKLLIY